MCNEMLSLQMARRLAAFGDGILAAKGGGAAGTRFRWESEGRLKSEEGISVDHWALLPAAFLLPQQVAPALHSAVLSEAGFSSLQELQEEIEARKGCVIAQALPVVVRGIRDMLSRCVRQVARRGKRGHFQQV